MPQLITVPTPASGQTRVTFTSAEVGNGNPNDAGTLTNQDGGLAVRVQAEAADGTLTGPITRYTDEDIVFVAGAGEAGTFDVRDLVSGVSRGNQFASVQLGTQGDDTLDSYYEDRAAYINGGQGDDDILGSTANDFLVGGAGDDILTGDLGDDSLLGGAGDDIAYLDASLDGSDTIDLGDGNDAVAVSRQTAGQVRLTFTSAEVGNGSANDGGTLANQDGGLAVRIQAENDAGELDGDVSRADDEGITFFADEGVTFDVRDLVSGVSRGNQFVTASLGTAASEVIEGTDEADYINAGQGNDRIFGDAGNDFLVGGAGNDTLDGGTGIDGLLGGGGNDTYGVDNAGDQVFEAVGGGNDQVIATTSYTLAAGQEIETIRFANAFQGAANLTGNEFDQTIRGNDAANTLDGKGGVDILIGRGGDDTYGVDNANDQVLEAVGGGNDQVIAFTTYTLAEGQEIETLRFGNAFQNAANLTGNEFDQSIRGNDAANTLDGKGGVDILTGRGGDDTYGVDNAGDQVLEAVGGGNDQVIATTSYTLAAGQEIETLRFGNAFQGAANLTGNEFGQSIRGNDAANVLSGGGGQDRLDGRAGEDRLDGGTGADQLFGGAGADTFVFSTALGNDNIDTLGDFSAADDTIQLSQAIFTALDAGQLSASAFKETSAEGATVDADDRILYDRSTGALSYDADGSGDGAAVQFATVANRTALTFQDFVVA